MQIVGAQPAARFEWDVDDAQLVEDEAWQEHAPRSSSPTAAPAKPLAPLTTAAELEQARTDDAPQVSPDVFHQGMVVRHPEYGLGKIVALGGSGLRRKATVAFASTAGEKNFVLAKSPLRPAKSDPS
jgi:DNA helicase-2/ATP-dependent DNA helicase PcrA